MLNVVQMREALELINQQLSKSNVRQQIVVAVEDAVQPTIEMMQEIGRLLQGRETCGLILVNGERQRMLTWNKRPTAHGFYWYREPGRPDSIALFDGEYLAFCGNHNTARPEEFAGLWLGPISPKRTVTAEIAEKHTLHDRRCKACIVVAGPGRCECGGIEHREDDHTWFCDRCGATNYGRS